MGESFPLKAFRILRQHPHPLRFLISRILWRSGLCRFFRIKRDRYRLRFYPSALSAEYWLNPNVRREDEQFIAAYLRPGEVFVDVGANIGALTLVAAKKVGNMGRVFAFEPHPRTYRFLAGNVALNRQRNVQLFNVALGNTRGELKFSSHRSDDQNEVTESGEITVPVDILDNILPSTVSEITLMKIDVEGYEKFVLEGATETMAKTSCVYFEAWDTHYKKYGYEVRDVIGFFRARGFEVFRKDGMSWKRVEEGYQAEYCQNLWAVRDVADFRCRISSEEESEGGGEV